MGTGSVTNRLLRLLSVCRRCLSPFSDGECRAPWKKGKGTSRPRFAPHFRWISARSQSPFSTTRLRFEYLTKAVEGNEPVQKMLLF